MTMFKFDSPSHDEAIVPNEGVGDIRFGMTPAEVHKIAGNDFKPFRGRGAPSQFPSDHYLSLGMFCYYDESGALEGIEFHDPAHPTLDGVDLISMTLTESNQFMRSLGGEVKVDEEGAVAYLVGIGTWSSRDESEPIESVLVFRLGYDV